MSEDQWDKLAGLLQPHGISREDLFGLLEFIDAPRVTLKCLGQIAENLLEILPLVEKICIYSLIDTVNGLPQWMKAVRVIADRRAELGKVIEGINRPVTDTNNPPLRNYLQSNPAYAAVCCTPAKSSNKSAYRLLQAESLIALKLYREKYDSGLSNEDAEAFKSRKYYAFLDVRQFAEKMQSRLLLEFPAKPARIEDYYKTISDTIENFDIVTCMLLDSIFNEADTVNPKNNKKYEHILRFMEIAIERASPVRRTRKNSEPSGERPAIIEHTFAVDADDELRGPVEAGKKRQTGRRQEIRTMSMPVGRKYSGLIKQSGATPSEYAANIEIVEMADNPEKPTRGMSAAIYARHCGNAKDAISKRNQMLSGSYETLTDYEVSQLISGLIHIFFWTKQRDRTAEMAMDCKAALITVLLTSCEMESLPHLRVIERDDNLHEIRNHDPDTWYFSMESASWFLKPARPELADNRSAKSQFLQISSGVVLENNLFEFFAEMAERSGSNSKRHSPFWKPFDQEWEYYPNRIKTFLKYINSEYGSRLSIPRVEHFIFNEIARHHNSDIVAASLITGRHHVLSETGLHYTRISAFDLDRIYKDTWVEIAGRIKEHGTHIMPMKGGKLQSSEAVGTGVHIGSRMVPELADIAALVRKLQTELTAARKMPRGLSRIIEVHSRMTLYTVFMLSFATGYRAVADPLFEETELDEQSGFAMISDKEGEEPRRGEYRRTYYNTRIVWLPESCRIQLRHYRRHLVVFKNFAPEVNVKLYHRLAGKVDPGRKTNIPETFFIKPDQTFDPVAPGLLAREVSDVYSLPMNAHRHYLRSTLIRRGCNAEVINAFMGHAHIGQEPWGRYSGMSPIDYRNELARHIPEMLRELGWKPMSGLPG